MRKTWTKQFILDEQTCLTRDERKAFSVLKKKKNADRVNIKDILKDDTVSVAHRVWWLRKHSLENQDAIQDFAESKFDGKGRDAMNHLSTKRGPLSTPEGVQELIDYLGL